MTYRESAAKKAEHLYEAWAALGRAKLFAPTKEAKAELTTAQKAIYKHFKAQMDIALNRGHRLISGPSRLARLCR